MKKKEILIIFVLALLVTAGSSLVCWHSQLTNYTFCFIYCGFPFPFFAKISYHVPVANQTPPEIIYSIIGLDFLFWFFILLIGWWVLKKFKKQRK